MKKSKQIVFKLVKDQLKETSSLHRMMTMVNNLDDLNALFTQHLSDLAKLCYCGALDYDEDLIVFYTTSNADFYRVNASVPRIQEFLNKCGYSFSKILIKVKPAEIKPRPKKKQLSEADYAALSKLAQAIERPDLLKPQPHENQDNSIDAEHESWHIKL
jgi:hypothetical protein